MNGEYNNFEDVEDVYTDDEDIFDEDSNDSDDEWEKHQKKLFLALVAYHIIKKKGMKKHRRRTKRHQNRRIAEMLLQEGIDDCLFRVEYRMSPESFRKLVGLIRNDLEPKDASRTRKDTYRSRDEGDDDAELAGRWAICRPVSSQWSE